MIRFPAWFGSVLIGSSLAGCGWPLFAQDPSNDLEPPATGLFTRAGAIIEETSFDWPEWANGAGGNLNPEFVDPEVEQPWMRKIDLKDGLPYTYYYVEGRLFPYEDKAPSNKTVAPPFQCGEVGGMWGEYNPYPTDESALPERDVDFFLVENSPLEFLCVFLLVDQPDSGEFATSAGELVDSQLIGLDIVAYEKNPNADCEAGSCKCGDLDQGTEPLMGNYLTQESCGEITDGECSCAVAHEDGVCPDCPVQLLEETGTCPVSEAACNPDEKTNRCRWPFLPALTNHNNYNVVNNTLKKDLIFYVAGGQFGPAPAESTGTGTGTDSGASAVPVPPAVQYHIALVPTRTPSTCEELTASSFVPSLTIDATP